VVEAAASFCPHCGARLGSVPPQDALIGELLDDRYLITSLVGRGGTATVYAARHQHLGRDVAVKALHSDVSKSGSMIERFKREARAASRVDHTNVVHTYDFARDPRGFYYLVMELVAGRELADVIAEHGPLPLPRVLHVLSQVAAALARCHELGLIHRDLKTENVMLTRRGNDGDFVKVVDLGLARTVEVDEELPKLTAVNALLGTPASMAPEQWGSDRFDERTDVYALGVLAYELLTSRAPFEKKTIQAYMFAHMNDAPVPPSRIVPRLNLPAAVDTFVLKALEKSPAARFQSMPEVLTALGDLWSACAVRPGPGSTTYSGTAAAPPPLSESALPDPTVYASNALDLVWDVPSLCDEIIRLHQIRADRVRALLAAVWPGGPPREATMWLPSLEHVSVRLDEARRAVHDARERFDAEERMAAEVEASLRGRIIDLSLTAEDGPPTPEARAQRRTLERRMAKFDRQRDKARRELESEIEVRVREIHACLAQLDPIFATLMSVAQKAASATRVRHHLREVVKVDGAIMSYGGLLEALAEMVEE